MAVTEAPDGIRIGEEEPGGRLPMMDFDEWVLEAAIGELTAGEVKTIDFGDIVTFRTGQNLLVNLYDGGSAAHPGKLLIMHAWYNKDGENPGHCYVMFKNLDSSTVDFGNPQVTIGGWNTGS